VAPKTSLFSSVRKPPDQKDLFGNPAKPETPSTRHHNPDETPGTPPLHGLRLTDTARDKILSTTTERAVSGRGELPRRKFTEASSKRVQKRKQSGISSPRHRPTARSDYGANTTTDDETSDEAGHQHHPGNLPRLPKVPKPKKGILNGSGSKWDHHFPVLVSSYLQLFFNIFIVVVVLYLLTSFLRTIQADVDTKVRQSAQKRLSEISECSSQFTANRCGTGYRVPAVEALCAKWEMCMSQDPDEVGRAKVSAQTFAEILNSLIEPISYKAMVWNLFLPLNEPRGIANLYYGSSFVQSSSLVHYTSRTQPLAYIVRKWPWGIIQILMLPNHQIYISHRHHYTTLVRRGEHTLRGQCICPLQATCCRR